MYKTTPTFFIIIFTITSAISQFNSFDLIPSNASNYKPSYQSNYPEWGKMLYNENLNFNKLEEAYAQWDKSEEENFKALVRYYKLWKKAVAPYITPDGTISLEDVNIYQQNIYTQQLQHRTTTTALRSGENKWTFLGPKETFWLNESGSSEEPEACPWQVNIYAFLEDYDHRGGYIKP